jgi:hypothetical protein
MRELFGKLERGKFASVFNGLGYSGASGVLDRRAL